MVRNWSSLVRCAKAISVALPLLGVSCTKPAGRELEIPHRVPTNGPLHISDNPRYFADRDGQVVYLTGAHTWASLQDNGPEEHPVPFNYSDYLDRLVRYGHNFFRLWVWEQSRWTAETAGDYWFTPVIYARTGPGLALDGRPRFDVSRFNDAYFDRMRERVQAARDQGIYVSIMLFNGWSVGTKGRYDLNNPWRGHPFYGPNNVNGLNGDLNGDGAGYEVHSLADSSILAVQKRYVSKVIDTVGDLDNVLYEVSNESEVASMPWQEEIVRYIWMYESRNGFPKHPVGITVPWPGGENSRLLAGPADWISPNGGTDDPPVADGRKVIIEDTDHLCGTCGDPLWVWKSFLRGRNPILMDPYDGLGIGVGAADEDANDPTWEAIRLNMGYAAAYAQRIDLAEMSPRGDLTSSRYCLAKVGGSQAEYLILLPAKRSVSVDLSAAHGRVALEWFSPTDGKVVAGDTVGGGSVESFHSPVGSPAVLYIRSIEDPK